MSRKFQFRKRLIKRRKGFNNGNGHGKDFFPAPKNPHEEEAERILKELHEDGVFTFVRRNNYLDREGLDYVLGRYVCFEGHGKELRIHIQHKARESEAKKFRKTNPSLPVWVHHASMTSLEGKINLLTLIADLLENASSPYDEIFKEKLVYFESLKEKDSQTA